MAKIYGHLNKENVAKSIEHHLLLEKYKLKSQWNASVDRNASVDLLEWLKQCGERPYQTWSNRNSHSSFHQRNAKAGQPLWKIVWQFLIKLYIYLLYDPAILLLGMHPREVKNLCLQPLHKYLIATWFKIAPTWKQPKCPSSKWLNTHTVKYYSNKKEQNIDRCKKLDSY